MLTVQGPDLFCSKCGRFIGSLDEGELEFMRDCPQRSVLCFHCEGESNDVTLPLFWDWWAGDFLGIDNLRFTVIVDKDFRHKLVPVYTRLACAHVRIACLVSTYLNIINKNQGPGSQCPNCGEAELRPMEEEVFCPACLYQAARGSHV